MQKTLIYIDINTRAQIDGVGEFITRSGDYLNIERGQWQILCVQFYNRTIDENGAIVLDNVALSSDSSFVMVADNDFNDEDNLMLKSLQSVIPFDESDPTTNMFNISGDWIDGATASAASGQLSIRVNSDTLKFKTVLGDAIQKASGLYLNIKQYSLGLSNPSTIAWIPFVAKNTVRDWSSAQVVPPTGTTAMTYINTYFRNPLERQWSEDGVTWYDSYAEAHNRYYRERIANIDADWGVTIPTAKGYTYVPEIDTSGTISWTNDGDLPNPHPVNVRGHGLQIDSFGVFDSRPTIPPSTPYCYYAIDSGYAYFYADSWSGGVPIVTDDFAPLMANYYNKAQVDSNIENAVGAIDLDALTDVEIVDVASGNTLKYDGTKWVNAVSTGGGEGAAFYSPVANYLVYDATYGAVYYLDSTIPSIKFVDRVSGLKKVRMEMVSANPAVTGNVVIVPSVDSADLTPITIEVTSSITLNEFELSSAVRGRFSLRRDYAAAADTLDDVTAIVTVLRILEV